MRSGRARPRDSAASSPIVDSRCALRRRGLFGRGAGWGCDGCGTLLSVSSSGRDRPRSGGTAGLPIGDPRLSGTRGAGAPLRSNGVPRPAVTPRRGAGYRAAPRAAAPGLSEPQSAPRSWRAEPAATRRWDRNGEEYLVTASDRQVTGSALWDGGHDPQRRPRRGPEGAVAAVLPAGCGGHGAGLGGQGPSAVRLAVGRGTVPGGVDRADHRAHRADPGSAPVGGSSDGTDIGGDLRGAIARCPRGTVGRRDQQHRAA